MNQTFNSRANAGQLLDLTGCGFAYDLTPQHGGPLHPTDIDAVMELHSTKSHPLVRGGFVFCEYKCRDVKMPKGQEEMYVHLADAVAATGDNAYVAECQHKVYDADQDIDAGATPVSRLYIARLRRWVDIVKPLPVRDLLNIFATECRSGKYYRWSRYATA